MIYRRYFRYVFLYKWRLVTGVILSLISALVTLSPIFIIQYIVKSAFEEKNMNNLFIAIGFGLIAIILIFFFTYLSHFMMEYLSKKIIYKVRGELFSHLMYLPLKFYKDSSAGNTLSIMTNDIGELQNFTANCILNLIKEPVIIIIAVIKMFDLNFELTALIFILAPFFIIVIHYLAKKVKRLEMSIREKLSKLTSIIHQSLYGIVVVKVFAMEKQETDNFESENKSHLESNKRMTQYINLARPLIDFIGGLGILFLLGVGGYNVIQGSMTTSQLTALIVALTTISIPIKNLSDSFINIKKTYASLKRIFEILDVTKENEVEHNKINPETINGKVRFENVSFSYGNENVLSNINIEVEAGKTVAIVGHSGSGKTTLISLLPQLFQVTSGKIYIDGIDIKELNLNTLRRKISIVTQENIIFNATVKENISYGNPDATIEEIIETSRISNALEFIEKLPDGFNTLVGDRGTRLSGGQCQRISLARAILKKPAILILDEATSSLDSESEKLIQKALEKIIKNQTTFIISHRLSTIFHADIIYVLDKGEIIQTGTHEELLSQSGIYKKLYDFQFNI